MNKCSCYYEEITKSPRYDVYTGNISHYIEVMRGKCNGTKEQDECSCGGDRTKCDFYPEVRKTALNESNCQFGEWISVEDRLPKDAETVLAFCKDGGMFVGRHMSWGHWEIWTAMKSTRIVRRTVTYWMPLPEPPKGE